MTEPNIIGAGLSGLIAAHAIRDARVFERNEPGQMHNALLRFRTDVVSRLTNIPFKAVRVRKAIFTQEGFWQPTINLCNTYARKVLGTVDGNRSIWNLDPVTRYIAPPDFYERMVEHLSRQGRLHFNSEVDLCNLAPHSISTAPLPSLLKAVGMDPDIDFSYQPIYVLKMKLDSFKNVYQTIYYPNMSHGLYRASITDDTLICEFVRTTENDRQWLMELAMSFGMAQVEVNAIKDRLVAAEMDGGIKTQKYGKIIPITSGVRHSLLLAITAQFGIYSLGRFATWRNILLDDVVEDALQIEKMLDSDSYTAKLQRTKKRASHLN